MTPAGVDHDGIIKNLTRLLQQPRKSGPILTLHRRGVHNFGCSLWVPACAGMTVLRFVVLKDSTTLKHRRPFFLER